jgi:hypothetical protein
MDRIDAQCARVERAQHKFDCAEFDKQIGQLIRDLVQARLSLHDQT